VAVSSNETAPRHLTAEEFKKSAAVNCRGIVKPAAVNYRRVFQHFICVFQPSYVCEQQFSYGIATRHSFTFMKVF
jgi:hypothetical protein